MAQIFKDGNIAIRLNYIVYVRISPENPKNVIIQTFSDKPFEIHFKAESLALDYYDKLVYQLRNNIYDIYER